MSMHYCNPARESDPHALPDLEVFCVDALDALDGEALEPGFYWQACFPGCLPDGDPIGPFATERDALADAREGVNDHGSA